MALSRRAVEEEQRFELDRLIRIYDRCRRACERQRQRQRLLHMLRHRATAVRDTEASREAVAEVVALVALERADTPAELQMCAAALLARLTDSPDGARAVLACGGALPLYTMWVAASDVHARAPEGGGGAAGGGAKAAAREAAAGRTAVMPGTDAVSMPNTARQTSAAGASPSGLASAAGASGLAAMHRRHSALYAARPLSHL